MRLILLALSGLAAATGVAAEPASPARSFDGKALFEEKCTMCHRAGGMGTVLLSRRVEAGKAQLEARDDLTADYVTAAARSGIGNMPRISRGEVSDRQMAAIAAYLAKSKAR